MKVISFHAVTTLAEADLFRIALNVADSLNPLSNEEIQKIKEKALKGNALFKYEGS
ncbi:MAG: hypothetical protein WCG82_09365 [Bacteroidota bacterium]